MPNTYGILFLIRYSAMSSPPFMRAMPKTPRLRLAVGASVAGAHSLSHHSLPHLRGNDGARAPSPGARRTGPAQPRAAWRQLLAGLCLWRGRGTDREIDVGGINEGLFAQILNDFRRQRGAEAFRRLAAELGTRRQPQDVEGLVEFDDLEFVLVAQGGDRRLALGAAEAALELHGIAGRNRALASARVGAGLPTLPSLMADGVSAPRRRWPTCGRRSCRGGQMRWLTRG